MAGEMPVRVCGCVGVGGWVCGSVRRVVRLAGEEVLEGGVELRVAEAVAGGEEAGGEDAAALEEEFGFRLEDESADLQHPGGRGQADGLAADFAEGAHELAVRDRVRGGDVDRACQLVMVQ